MSIRSNNQYTKFRGIDLKDDGNAARGINFPDQTTARTYGADDRVIYVEDGSLKYWSGTSAVTLGSTVGGGTSLNDAYDDGSTITIDSAAVTLAGSHATNNVMEITGTAATAGNMIDITNSGSGKDIDGTSSTWSIAKTGAAIFNASVTSPAIVAYHAGANGNLTIDAKGSGTITVGGTSTGAITLTRAVTATASLTVTGAAGSAKLTVTAGDVSVADGSVTIADDDNAASLSVANSAATTIGAAAAGGVVQIAAPAVTTGAIVSIEATEGTLNGGWYLRAWDVTGSAQVFSIGEDGATVIAGAAAGTNALTVTAGDIFVSDSDTSVFESEDGVGTLLKLDNKAGVIASDAAVLLLDAGGAVASGGNILRVAPTGTPNAGAIGIEYVGASKAMQAMFIDGDPTANSLVEINGGGALTDGLGVLKLTNDGNLASGGNVLNITVGGTPNTAACALEIASAKDCFALDIATSAATNSAVRITGAGAIADDKALLEVIDGGTPANTGSNVARLAFTGTATNKSKILELVGTGKAVSGMYSVTDNTTTHGVSIAGAGALATGGRMLLVTNTGTPAANTDSVAEVTFGGTATNNPIVLNVNNGTANAVPLYVNSNVGSATRQVAMIVQDSTTGAIEPLLLQQDDTDQAIMKLAVAAPGAGTTVTTDDKSGGAAVYIKITINAAAYWIKATPGA